MVFLSIGQKDEFGNQRRIEHRGKYLRASSTGGVALQAQAKALGASLTANTNHGFRVSTNLQLLEAEESEPDGEACTSAEEARASAG